MARRRNWGAAFSAAAQANTPLIQALIQRRRDADEHTRQLERDRIQTESARQGTLLSGAVNNPEVARRLMADGTTQAGGVNLSGLAPTQDEDLAKLTAQIRGATSLNELPTLTGIATEARSRGHEDPYFQGPFPEIKIGDKSFGEHAAMPIRPEGQGPSQIQDLITATLSKEKQLTRAIQQGALAEEHYNPETGAKQRQAGGMTIQTTPTPKQSGQNWLTQAQSGEGSKEGRKVKTDVTEAEQLGMYSDPVIAQRLKLTRGQEMARSAADINTVQQTTVGERMAGSQAVALQIADADATALEDKGASWTFMSDIASKGPGWSMMANAAGKLAPKLLGRTQADRDYATAAENFLTTYGKITSGVTVREDERPRWLSALFAVSGDPQETIIKKRQYRNALTRASAITSGRSGPDTGLVLGRMFANGELPIDLLYTMKMDPEIAKATYGVLRAAGMAE